MKSLQENPYRILFPLGWLMAFLGAFVWVWFKLNPEWGYPGVQHPQIMMGGFLASFVIGFLMTAAPKFTGSFPAAKSELLLISLAAVAMCLSAALGEIVLTYLFNFLAFLLLFLFLVRRFLARRNNPPAPFVFVLLGVASVMIASFYLVMHNQWHWEATVTSRLAELFYRQGYILALVMGIGSRLVPALLGWMPSPLEGRVLFKVLPFVLLMVLTVFSYFLEALGLYHWGALLRLILFAWLSLKIWRIYHLPKNRTYQAWLLWLSAWMVLIGFIGQLYQPYRVHFLHLLYIGGFGLMTMMVAVRVILSHGGHGLQMESKSHALWWVGGFVVVSALLRLAAAFWGDVHWDLIAGAGIIWCVACLIWAFVFLPRLMRIKEEH